VQAEVPAGAIKVCASLIPKYFIRIDDTFGVKWKR